MNSSPKIMRPDRVLGAIATAALWFLLLPSGFSQGSLTPPGPPAPTMKTLDQVEPRIDLQSATATAVTTTNANYHFIINQPGSYYLSANLGVTKTNGIQINAEGVTLDLNGFEISRSTGSGGYGVEIVATSHRASVRDGSVKGFGYGVAGASRGCGFRDLSVSSCTTGGILAGPGAVLESCRAHDNTGTWAIVADVSSSLTNCVAVQNTTTYGILAGNGSSLANCTAYNNTGGYGIFAGNGSSLTNCTAYSNTANYGILAQTGSSLTNCSAYLNNSAAATSFGIGVGNACTISHCTASYNGTFAAATSSTGMGFSIGDGSTIHDCTANYNKGDGIKIYYNSVARDNTSNFNGQSGGNCAGLHVVGVGNRIEGNNVTGNPRGIEIGQSGNLIIGNSAKTNFPNYSIVANNVYGPIVDRVQAVSAAVNGNSAASSIGTTDPWANISY